jgi:acyl transferase domain-containing protein
MNVGGEADPARFADYTADHARQASHEPAPAGPRTAIAIVGMACLLPGASEPAQLHELVLARRQLFRQLHYPPIDRLCAALIEGWAPSPASSGLPDHELSAITPVRLLAAETARRALADSGLRGEAPTRDRTGVIIAGLSQRLELGGGLGSRGPEPGRDLPSSLHAVVVACAALTEGDVDLALAGGADVGLDPVWVARHARAGTLAADEMRVYDAHPTGPLPGDGCGIVVLMRAADARAAGLPVYAEIAGWSTEPTAPPCDVRGTPAPPRCAPQDTPSAPQDTPGASQDTPGASPHARHDTPAGVPLWARRGAPPGAGSGVTATLLKAYERAGVDPADIQLIEGEGAATASGDLAELTALSELYGGARRAVALGAISASIGHARAATGIAGLLKTALAMAAGTIPPATGYVTPHPLLTGDAPLRLAPAPEPWPDGIQLAAVNSMGVADAPDTQAHPSEPSTAVHLVLRREPDRSRPPGRRRRAAATQDRDSETSAVSVAIATETADEQERPDAQSLLPAPTVDAKPPILGSTPWASEPSNAPVVAKAASAAWSAQPEERTVHASRPASSRPIARSDSVPLPASANGVAPAEASRVTHLAPDDDRDRPFKPTPTEPEAQPGGVLGGTAVASAADSAGSVAGSGPALGVRARPGGRARFYPMCGPDRQALAAALEGIAAIAMALSDSELGELARQLTIDVNMDAEDQGPVRVALVAGGQEQLAERARRAARLMATPPLPPLAPHTPHPPHTPRVLDTPYEPHTSHGPRAPMVAEPGIYISDGAKGRVVLLFPGLADTPIAHSALLSASLGALSWLAGLGVASQVAVGYSTGEITGLTWAGCLSEAEAARLVAQRGEVLRASANPQTAMVRVATDAAASRSLCSGTDVVIAAYEGPRAHVLAGSSAGVREVARRAAGRGIARDVLNVAHALHSPAMASCAAPLRRILAQSRFGPPRHRLVSTVTGRMVTAQDDIALLLAEQITAPVRFTEALAVAADGADLLCVAGPATSLGWMTAMAAGSCAVPAVGISGAFGRAGRHGPDDGMPDAIAALFTAGALTTLDPPRSPFSTGLDSNGLGASQVSGSNGTGQASGAYEISGSYETSRSYGTSSSYAAGEIAGGTDQAPVSMRGRFLETVRVHRPGVALVADTRVRLETDPYLADYRVDGAPVLPAVMSLEAMAQAASALAGYPMRRAEGVSLSAPPVIPAGEGTLLRVSARRTGDRVETVLQGETVLAGKEGGQHTEYARAVFGYAAAAGGVSPAQVTWPASDSSATPGDARGILDGTELYETVCFQRGRFRRVAMLPEITAAGSHAIVRGSDEQPWFGLVSGPSDAPLLLGSPGLNDAALQGVQACVPQRRLLAAGCESLSASGTEVRGAVEIRAVRRDRPGDTLGPADAPDRYVWDVYAFDRSGMAVVTWTGLRMRDAGPRYDGSGAGQPGAVRPGSVPGDAQLAPQDVEQGLVSPQIDTIGRTTIP